MTNRLWYQVQALGIARCHGEGISQASDIENPASKNYTLGLPLYAHVELGYRAK